MANTIAVTGKGGTGKTVVSALIVRWLVEHGLTPVLAVDADSNANLHRMLGVRYRATVGGIREDARNLAPDMSSGVSKPEYLSARIETALVEERGWDLIVMGQPEGPGCYCYANNVLRDVLQRLARSYRHVVVDCEAGLEHLSRRTLLSVDHLLTVSDPSIRGLETAVRVSRLADEMKVTVGRRSVVVNKTADPARGLTEAQRSAISDGGFENEILLPFDAAVAAVDEAGGSVGDIPARSPIREGIDAMLAWVLGDPAAVRSGTGAGKA